MTPWHELVKAACEAEEQFTLDELEAFADQLRKEDGHGEA